MQSGPQHTSTSLKCNIDPTNPATSRDHGLNLPEAGSLITDPASDSTTRQPRSSQHLAPSETRRVPLTRESEIQAVLREAFHQLRDHFAREDE